MSNKWKTRQIFMVRAFSPAGRYDLFRISGRTKQEAIDNAYALVHAAKAPEGTTLVDIVVPGAKLTLETHSILDTPDRPLENSLVA